MGYETAEDAVLAVLAEARAGDEITIHQQGCALKWDLDCDCTPKIQVVEVGRA